MISLTGEIAQPGAETDAEHRAEDEYVSEAPPVSV
jgi:hypothetical protein